MNIEMPAGRELDALVAEKVMGLCAHVWEWKVVRSSPCALCGSEENDEYLESIGDYPPKICNKCGKKVYGLKYEINGRPDCPDYSTSLSAAWEVVEKLINFKDGRRWAIYPEDDGSFTVECFPENYMGDLEKSCGSEFSAEAPTAPLAICRAALKAVGAGDTTR